MRNNPLKIILLFLFCFQAFASNSRQFTIILHLTIKQNKISSKVFSPYIARIGEIASTDTTTKKEGTYSSIDTAYHFNLELNDSNAAAFHLFFKYDSLFYEIPLYWLTRTYNAESLNYFLSIESIDKTTESSIYMYKYLMQMRRDPLPGKHLNDDDFIFGYYKYDLCYRMWYR